GPAAPARRSTSLRARLPPQAALARAHRQRAGRRARRRADAAGGAAQGIRLGRRVARGERRADRRACARAARACRPRRRVPLAPGGGGMSPLAPSRPRTRVTAASPLLPAAEAWLDELLKGRRLSERTLDAYRRDLADYREFARGHALTGWHEATPTFVDGY